ncbi:MAG: DUF427 domain-containing protein [Actinobacteria bacterium]|nr:MAG: DUF427 domain-containing protein [Actinomycetota bacterium]
MRGHRITVEPDPRLIEVVVDGVTIASSTRTVALHETGLPVRHYFDPADVRTDLLTPTPTQTACPFKGEASYWSLRVGDVVVADAAWSYEHPIDGMEAIGTRLCFFAERATHVIDGEVQGPPETQWSPTART